jgi:hypothetical protein
LKLRAARADTAWMPSTARPRRLLATALLLSLTTVLGACGGGSDDGVGGGAVTSAGPAKTVAAAPSAFQAKSSLLKGADSAAGGAAVKDYAPTGEIIADSGFRPWSDGFAFENYGNDVGPVNLGPEQMENLFGAQVCLGGSGPDCQLIPAAQTWMDNQNEGMAGGHCEGFSITALRMQSKSLRAADYGADKPIDLAIVDNLPLQSTIAESFVYQFLPRVVRKRVEGTPTEVTQRLVDALNNGDERYTLGIYKPDYTGGHAITPFAVEDKGKGQYAILVYDNNFPGVTRAVEVDANKDSWRYVGGTNPKDLGQVYKGNASTGTLELDPTTPGEGQQPCPFCRGRKAGGDQAKGSLLPVDQRYTEITLTGDPRNHPHLIFSDDQGRRTGIVDGKMLREIPDVQVVKTYAISNWGGAPEPRFRLPEGADYTISVDGSDLTKTAKPTINLVGNGLVIDVEDITIAPGQVDEMALPGGYGITYLTNAKDGIAPNFFAGLVENGAAYNFAASAVGLKTGSTVSLLVEQKEKVVILDSTGSEGADGGNAVFILQLVKAGAKGKPAAWQNAGLELDGAAEEKAAFEYGTSPRRGKPLPIVLLDGNSDVTGTVVADPQ